MNDALPQPTTSIESLPQPSEHERSAGEVSHYTLRGKHVSRTSKQRIDHGINKSLPSALYNDHDAAITFQRETPQKRHILELSIQGFTNKEIAAYMGCTIFTVSQTLKQPWAREYMINRMQNETNDSIQELLKSEVVASLNTIVEIRDNDQASPQVRAAQAQYLLDRVLGKAAQPIISAKVDVAKATDAELDAIIASGINATKRTLDTTTTSSSSTREETPTRN